METILLDRSINLLQKKARAQAIADYLKATGRKSCVCYTCGNASKALRKVGLQVREVLKPNRWYTFIEIQNLNKRFDATSGHIPLPLVRAAAYNLAAMIGQDKYWKDMFEQAATKHMVFQVPTGSGETLLTLCMIFPLLNFIPAYNLDDSTQFSPKAPLNGLVLALAYGHEVIDYSDKAVLQRVKEKLGLVD